MSYAFGGAPWADAPTPAHEREATGGVGEPVAVSPLARQFFVTRLCGSFFVQLDKRERVPDAVYVLLQLGEAVSKTGQSGIRSVD
jgi:hypothetical protein